jgi:hypothetical protein
VSVFLLGKLVSKHAPTNHDGRLLSQIGCFFASAKLVHHDGMMRGDGGGELGGIGPGDEVFCSMPFLASINRGGQCRPTAAMKPHSRLLSIQQSTNILCNRLVSLKLEKTIIINVY